MYIPVEVLHRWPIRAAANGDLKKGGAGVFCTMSFAACPDRKQRAPLYT
jgi:hypothetical protein